MSKKKLQRDLQTLGYYSGEIDGELGPKSNAAIIAFKSAHGLRPREYVGPVTLRAIERAVIEHQARVIPAACVNEPSWIKLGRQYLGLREIKGWKHNPKILEWFAAIKNSWITDDETPWCAAAVGGVLVESGVDSSRKPSARSYLEWGQETEVCVGAVVVFWRGKKEGWQGHVGFVIGKSADGKLMVMGGNQGDEFNIQPKHTYRVLGYRWPDGVELPAQTGMENLPVIDSHGKISTTEA